MKKVFLTLVLVATVATAYTQTFTSKSSSNGGGFNVEDGIQTVETFTIDGTYYDVFETENGSKYIKLLSPRTGNYYPLWIFEATPHTFEGRRVYETRNGSYCIYVVSENSGNPYCKWLDKE